METSITHGIRVEIVPDVLAALRAHWPEVAAQALDAEDPDSTRIAKIEADQRKLRHDLDRRDAALLGSVVAERRPHAWRLCVVA